ncbi:MAG: hypothetical protein HYS13_07900 [Planctomycetia bacterium]|nr:hypothetical protein [Planctomycetia bacterium]
MTGRFVTFVILALCTLGLRAGEVRRSTVGFPTRIEGIVLPGFELEAEPLDRQAPLVVRIEAVYPHGTAFRYDLVYYGLEPGKYDLKDYLRRKDGTSTADLPSIEVEITSLLPPGQVQPHALAAQSSPFPGGYRTMLWIGGVLWAIGLAAILLVGRRKKRPVEGEGARPLTLADRLRPLVEGAMAGTLSTSQRAELERTLLSFWSQRLGLCDLKPAEIFAVLRRHPEAAALIQRLELWLHCPAPTDRVDIAALLAPYQVADARSEVPQPVAHK